MWVAVKGERDYQAGDLRVFWMCLLTSSRRRRRQIKFREVPFKKAMVILQESLEVVISVYPYR